jgi:diguanylate cyclase (GGDEF)-like protein
MMPEMDGYATIKALKNNSATNSIPVIFVTAKDDAKDEEKGFSLGAVDYISKPFHPRVVKARVKTHVALKLKTDQLEELSMKDGLTQIPNRRFFDGSLSKEYNTMKREQTPLSLMMIDIDFFKPFNDHYGHGEGDIALQHVAKTLSHVFKRPRDLVARYGGEEFSVILPNTTQEQAKELGALVLERTRELSIVHAYSSVAKHLTVSVGIATTSQDVHKKEEFLKKADMALYDAKEAGRDRVVSVRYLKARKLLLEHFDSVF